MAACKRGARLDDLPLSVLEAIFARVDETSLFSAAASCRSLRAAVYSLVGSSISLNFVKISLDDECIRRLLAGNDVLQKLTLNCRSLNDGALPSVVKPSLQHLDMLCTQRFSIKLLYDIGNKCLNLRSLSLPYLPSSRDTSGPHDLLTEALVHLLKNCSRIEALALGAPDTPLGQEVPISIAQYLRSSLLSLSMYIHSTAEAALIITGSRKVYEGSGKGCCKLESLSFQIPPPAMIDDSLLIVISRNLSHLKKLELVDWPQERPFFGSDLSSWGVAQLFYCQELQHLYLARCMEKTDLSFEYVTDNGLLLLAQDCRKLESVILEGFTRVTDAPFQALLSNCSGLTTLDLPFTKQLTDLAFTDILVLDKIPPLERVSLASCFFVTDISLVNLSFCSGLKSLNLETCASVGDYGVEAIAALPKLNFLVLDETSVTDMGLVHLGSGKAPLQVLYLRGCRNVTDLGMAALVSGHLKDSLRELDLSLSPLLTDRTPLALARNSVALEKLYMSHCPCIRDGAIVALATCEVNVNNSTDDTSISKIECSANGTVEEESEHSLKPEGEPSEPLLCSLKVLDLSKSGGITGGALKWLKPSYFPKLRQLNLPFLGVKKEVLEQHASAWPSCKWLWDGTPVGLCDHFWDNNFSGNEDE